MSSFIIRHNIPGRLRLKAASRSDFLRLSGLCAVFDGKVQSRANPLCLSIIISYDCKATKAIDLLDSLERAWPSATGGDAPAPAATSGSCACAGKQTEASFGGSLLRFAALSLASAWVFIRTSLLKGSVAQGAFSPLGLVVFAAAVPLLKEACQHAKAGRFTLEAFLAGGCLLASASGQALAALEILWIHSGAESLKAWVAERSRRSISGILDLTAKNTFIIAGDVEVEVPVSAVKVRDIVVLHTGEKISVDGTIIKGEALVDDSPLTGRSELAHLGKGDKVFAGSYMHQGLVQVRVECVGDNSYLARIMRQVEELVESRAPIESLADDLARGMVRLGLVSTLLTLLVSGSPWRAFTVLLIMACPCATTLAARTAVSAAMSAAARRGILIKGGRYLEEAGKAEVVCFDKTGTLTTSMPRIESILNFSELSEDELLIWACSAELHNHHPLAQAIKKAAQERELDPLSHLECDFTLGKGVRARVGLSHIRIGNARYLEDAGIAVAPVRPKVGHLEKRGLTLVYLAKDMQLLAVFAFANEIRPGAAAAVAALRKSGVKKIALITGDSKNTALELCAVLGIEDCRHSVLPEEKGKIVGRLKEKGSRVIMVGDGINDALALAEADIGMAMSASGSDVAIEAADIALVNERLEDIVYVRALSQKTMQIARQNFCLAAGSNIAGALAGALGLISPVSAGLLHIVHTLGVLANSSRLLLPDSSDRSPDRQA